MSDAPSSWNLLHLLWLGAAGAFRYLWLRIDGKADKTDLSEKHDENRLRFDEILSLMRTNAQLDRDARHEMRDKIGALTTQVAVLTYQAEMKLRP